MTHLNTVGTWIYIAMKASPDTSACYIRIKFQPIFWLPSICASINIDLKLRRSDLQTKCSEECL
jgi:hypothetical protein